MNNYIKRVFAVLWLTIFYSCETNIIDDHDKFTPGLDFAVTETTEDYSITYKLNDNVIVLDDKNSSYLVKVEDDSVLFFSKSTPSNIIPEVGTIISSRISEKSPYGLGNVVLEKSEIDGMIKCVTTVAPLDDIFEELELTSHFSLANLVKDTTGFYDDEGNYYDIKIKDEDLLTDSLSDSFATRLSSARATLGSRKILEIPIDIVKVLKDTPSNGKKNPFFAKLVLQIGGIVTFNKSKEQNTFENSLEISLGIKGNFGLKGEVTFLKEDLIPQISKILELVKKKEIISGNLPIAGGLINLRPYVDFEAYIKGRINGSFSVGIGSCWGYKCGWTEKGFFKENTSTEPKIGNIIKPFSINGKAEIGPEAVFHLGCGIYTKELALLLNVKPSLMVGAELGISGQLSDDIYLVENQSFNLDCVLDIDGEIIAELFGMEFYKSEVPLARVNLYNVSIPIFPEIQSGSFIIEKINDDPLSFNAEYTVTGGFIAKVLGGAPALKVEDAGNEVYHIVDGQEIYYTAPSRLCYELTGLSKKKTYTAVPCIVIGNRWYKMKGKSFSDDEDETPDDENETPDDEDETPDDEDETPDDEDETPDDEDETPDDEDNTPDTIMHTCPDSNHPHLIDLGLPSGTKWECCNVGATKPEEFGNYYYWYDAWKTAGEQLPSHEQLEELFECCSWTWTNIDGINGYQVKGENGEIFLPASGKYFINDRAFTNINSEGRYWSKTPYKNNDLWAIYLTFKLNSFHNSAASKGCYKLSVRRVSNE